MLSFPSLTFRFLPSQGIIYLVIVTVPLLFSHDPEDLSLFHYGWSKEVLPLAYVGLGEFNLFYRRFDENQIAIDVDSRLVFLPLPQSEPSSLFRTTGVGFFSVCSYTSYHRCCSFEEGGKLRSPPSNELDPTDSTRLLLRSFVSIAHRLLSLPPKLKIESTLIFVGHEGTKGSRNIA